MDPNEDDKKSNVKHESDENNVKKEKPEENSSGKNDANNTELEIIENVNEENELTLFEKDEIEVKKEKIEEIVSCSKNEELEIVEKIEVNKEVDIPPKPVSKFSKIREKFEGNLEIENLVVTTKPVQLTGIQKELESLRKKKVVQKALEEYHIMLENLKNDKRKIDVDLAFKIEELDADKKELEALKNINENNIESKEQIKKLEEKIETIKKEGAEIAVQRIDINKKINDYKKHITNLKMILSDPDAFGGNSESAMDETTLMFLDEEKKNLEIERREKEEEKKKEEIRKIQVKITVTCGKIETLSIEDISLMEKLKENAMQIKKMQGEIVVIQQSSIKGYEEKIIKKQKEIDKKVKSIKEFKKMRKINKKKSRKIKKKIKQKKVERAQKTLKKLHNNPIAKGIIEGLKNLYRWSKKKKKKNKESDEEEHSNDEELVEQKTENGNQLTEVQETVVKSIIPSDWKKTTAEETNLLISVIIEEEILTESIKRMDFTGNQNVKRSSSLLQLLSLPNLGLETLNLSNTNLDDEFVVPLMESIKKNKTSKLRKLILFSNKIGVEGGKSMGEMLTVNQSIEELEIQLNPELDETCFYNIMKGILKNISSKLTKLNCSNCSISINSKNLLLTNLKNSSLKELCLLRNNLSGNLVYLAKLIENLVGLEVLDMENCQLSCASVKQLYDSIEKHQSLKKLDIRNNSIGSDGMEAISNFRNSLNFDIMGNPITNESLKFFIGKKINGRNLRRTNINDEGVQTLVKIIKENPIKIVDLSKTLIKNEDNVIGSLLEIKELLSLNLSYNDLKNEAILKFCNELGMNNTLERLELNRVGIDGNNFEKGFWKCLFNGKPLRTFSIANNVITDQGFVDFFDVITTQCKDNLFKLNYLDLENTGIKKNGLDKLYEMLKTCKFRSIQILLQNNGLKDDDVFDFFEDIFKEEVLVEGTLDINFSSNDITLKGLEQLMTNRDKYPIQDLSKVKVRIYLYSVKTNTDEKLDKLMFYFNNIEDYKRLIKDEVYFGIFLPTKIVKRLRKAVICFKKEIFLTESVNMSSLGINHGIMKEISEEWVKEKEKLQKITSFNISNNKLDVNASLELCKILRECVNMKSLDLTNCQLFDDGLSMLLGVIIDNPNVKNVSLSGNPGLIGKKTQLVLEKRQYNTL